MRGGWLRDSLGKSASKRLPLTLTPNLSPRSGGEGSFCLTNHMVTVFIPPLLRSSTSGMSCIKTEGNTVRQIVQDLERRHPGIAARLCEGERLKPGLAVSVNGTVSSLGLMQSVPDGAEVHFLPAIGGG